MFTFSIPGVRRVIESGVADATAHGGFLIPYEGISSPDQARAGLWLVDDEGVYLCSNGKLAANEKPFVFYSEQCHPKGDFDWWDYKRRHFGADDGVEFIEAERLLPLFNRNMRATHLNLALTETEITISLFTR